MHMELRGGQLHEAFAEVKQLSAATILSRQDKGPLALLTQKLDSMTLAGCSASPSFRPLSFVDLARIKSLIGYRQTFEPLIPRLCIRRKLLRPVAGSFPGYRSIPSRSLDVSSPAEPSRDHAPARRDIISEADDCRPGLHRICTLGHAKKLRGMWRPSQSAGRDLLENTTSKLGLCQSPPCDPSAECGPEAKQRIDPRPPIVFCSSGSSFTTRIKVKNVLPSGRSDACMSNAGAVCRSI